MLTIPGSFQVVCKRLISPDIWNYYSARRSAFRGLRGELLSYGLGAEALSLLRSHRDQWKSSLSSMDYSDLEAFSLNPVDDSVGALPFQATP